jgi:hypothetical protein
MNLLSPVAIEAAKKNQNQPILLDVPIRSSVPDWLRAAYPSSRDSPS